MRTTVCAAVRRVTSPRLILPSSSHRRLGSLRAGTGDAERAPSRERVVAPAERRRPRRACAGRTVDARARRRVRRRASSDITAPRPALLVAWPARLLSEPAPATPSARRAASEPSRRPSAADLIAHAPVVPSTHVRAAVCAAVRRVTSPCPVLLSSPARLSQSRRRRSRASADPRTSLRTDRAPLASSCVRPSYRRRSCALPCAPPCVE